MRSLALFLLVLCATVAQAAELEQLIAERFQLRVRIGGARERQVLETDDRCLLLNVNGEIARTVEPGTRLHIEVVRTVRASPEHRIWLGEFHPSRKTAARALAARIGQRLNFPTEVLEVEDAQGDVDHLLVTLGRFESQAEARAYLEGVRLARPLARLWTDTRERHLPVLGVADDDGNSLGDYLERVTVVPLSDLGTVGALRREEWRRYHGALICRGGRDSLIELINEVHPEDYVASVVAQEVGNRAPQATMRAQAIVARSEALHKVDSAHHRSPAYDLCDTTHCQDYRGVERETPGTRAAAQVTRGLVLMHRGEICDAIYSHSCGGTTAAMEAIWNSAGQPYIEPRIDTMPARDCPDLSDEPAAWSFLTDPPDLMCDPQGEPDFPPWARDHFRWTETFSAPELRRTYVENVGPLRHLRVMERSWSGRVTWLRFEGTEGNVDLRGSPEILSTLPHGVRSTLFVIAEDVGPDGLLEAITFIGGGWGNGVGLCQMGAYARGLRGQDHVAILRAYFPEAVLRRVY